MVFNDGLGGVVSPEEFQTYKTVEDLFVLLSDAYLNNFQRVEVRIFMCTLYIYVYDIYV